MDTLKTVAGLARDGTIVDTVYVAAQQDLGSWIGLIFAFSVTLAAGYLLAATTRRSNGRR